MTVETEHSAKWRYLQLLLEMDPSPGLRSVVHRLLEQEEEEEVK